MGKKSPKNYSILVLLSTQLGTPRVTGSQGPRVHYMLLHTAIEVKLNDYRAYCEE